MIGAPKMIPAAPLMKIPSFNNSPRLECPADTVIEFPHPLAAARPATPPHRRHLPEPSACRTHCPANPDCQSQAAPQLRLFGDTDRSPTRDTNHPRSTSP